MTLPPLKHVPSPNYSSRNGAKIDLIVVHDCEGSYAGSISWFSQKKSQVSAHIVLREDGGEATQMVDFADKAWHAVAFNSRSIGVEMAGYATKGYAAIEWQEAAEIVAYLLHKFSIPCQWAKHGSGSGFCSHYDLGQAGGGHSDPTTNPKTWQSFVNLVMIAYSKPPATDWPFTAGLKPVSPPHFVPTPTLRNG